MEQIKNISILLNPIMPITTHKVFKAMNLKKNDIVLENIDNLDCFDFNTELDNLEILFKKIEN